MEAMEHLYVKLKLKGYCQLTLLTLLIAIIALILEKPCVFLMQETMEFVVTALKRKIVHQLVKLLIAAILQLKLAYSIILVHLNHFVEILQLYKLLVMEIQSQYLCQEYLLLNQINYASIKFYFQHQQKVQIPYLLL